MGKSSAHAVESWGRVSRQAIPLGEETVPCLLV